MQIRGVVLWLINPAESRLTVRRRESRAKSGRDVKVKGCVTWSRALAGELIKASSTLRSWWTIDDGQGCCRDTPMIHLLLLLLARWMLSRSSASLPLDLPFSFSLALWSPCLGFTYLGHSSCTMSLCRYFRQRACLGKLSLLYAYLRSKAATGREASFAGNLAANITSELLAAPTDLDASPAIVHFKVAWNQTVIQINTSVLIKISIHNIYIIYNNIYNLSH